MYSKGWIQVSVTRISETKPSTLSLKDIWFSLIPFKKFNLVFKDLDIWKPRGQKIGRAHV